MTGFGQNTEVVNQLYSLAYVTQPGSSARNRIDAGFSILVREIRLHGTLDVSRSQLQVSITNSIFALA